MSSSRKVPAAVTAAVVFTVALALLFGGSMSVLGIVDHHQDLAIGGLVLCALLLVLAWRLRRGGRIAQLAGLAIGGAMIVAGFLQTQGAFSLIVFVLLGLILILILTVPASARAYFGADGGVTPDRHP